MKNHTLELERDTAHPWEISYGEHLNGRAAFINIRNYPTSGGYPFGSVRYENTLYTHQGRGYFSPESAAPEETRALYDDWAGYYDRQLPWTVGVGYDISRILFERDYRNGHVLDVCCGTGNTSLGLILGGVYPHRITGVDISGEMLKHAKSKPELKGVRFVRSDLTDYVPERTYNAIIGSLGLEYFVDHGGGRIFNTLNSSLVDGGLFVAAIVPNHESHIRLKQWLLRETRRMNIIELKYTSDSGIEFPLEILVFKKNDYLG